MSQKDYDLWLWLGLGVALYASIKTLRHQHSQIALLHPPESATKRRHNSADSSRSQSPLKLDIPEDAVPLWALETLITHPTYDIREAATKIVVDRWRRHPHASQHLHADLESDDEVKATRARTICAYVQQPYGEYMRNLDDVMDVLDVGDLEITAARSGAISHPLTLSVNDANASNSQAGNAESGTTPSTAAAQAAASVDRALTLLLLRRPTGISTAHTGAGRSTADLLRRTVLRDGNSLSAPVARLHEESPEEARRRRRRREAMVLNDDGGPLTQRNIIQRQTRDLELDSRDASGNGNGTGTGIGGDEVDGERLVRSRSAPHLQLTGPSENGEEQEGEERRTGTETERVLQHEWFDAMRREWSSDGR